MKQAILCKITDLEDPGSARFDLPVDYPPTVSRTICMIRRGYHVYGYINSCPHTLAPMDWQPGQFLSMDKQRIICSMHGAQFNIDDGYCILGPCTGSRLIPVDLELQNDQVVLKYNP